MEEEISCLLRLYRGQVLAFPTRTVQLLGRKCEARILRTFLGFELKLGRKRITCPDMSTARYLKVFGEMGLPRIRIPYDPTRTARLLPELERIVLRLKLRASEDSDSPEGGRRLLRRIFERTRRAVLEEAP